MPQSTLDRLASVDGPARRRRAPSWTIADHTLRGAADCPADRARGAARRTGGHARVLLGRRRHPRLAGRRGHHLRGRRRRRPLGQQPGDPLRLDAPTPAGEPSPASPGSPSSTRTTWTGSPTPGCSSPSRSTAAATTAAWPPPSPAWSGTRTSCWSPPPTGPVRVRHAPHPARHRRQQRGRQGAAAAGRRTARSTSCPPSARTGSPAAERPPRRPSPWTAAPRRTAWSRASAVSADGDGHGRLWRYAFSSDPARAGLLATDFAGARTPPRRTRRRPPGRPGVLSYRSAVVPGPRRRQPGRPRHAVAAGRDATAKATRCGSDEHEPLLERRQSGSLSYWEETGEVWSQSDRMLFALPLASIDRSLG